MISWLYSAAACPQVVRLLPFAALGVALTSLRVLVVFGFTQVRLAKEELANGVELAGGKYHDTFIRLSIALKDLLHNLLPSQDTLNILQLPPQLVVEQ